MKKVWASLLILAATLGISPLFPGEKALPEFIVLSIGIAFWSAVYGGLILVLSRIIHRKQPDNNFLHYFSRAYLFLVILACLGLALALFR